jgi:hypothetical protein
MSFDKQFSFRGETHQVSWIGADFAESVEGIDPNISGVLLDCAVMFNPPDSIFVSNRLMSDDPEVGELSALHEHICRCVGGMSCAEVEQTVIEETSSDEIRTRYVRIRSGLFVALTQLEPENSSFRQTHHFLQGLIKA